MKNLIPILLLLALPATLFSQTKFGFRIGTGLSADKWEYTGIAPDLETKSVVVYSAYASLEKRVLPFFSVRPEIGVLQRGHKIQFDFENENRDGFVDSPSQQIGKRTMAALNVGFKFAVPDIVKTPYLIAGVRGDILLNSVEFYSGYDDASRTEEATPIDYNKATFGAYIIAGYQFAKFLFVEAEYDPFMSNAYTNDNVKLKQSYFGLSVGVSF